VKNCCCCNNIHWHHNEFARHKNFSVVPRHFFGSTYLPTISRIGKRFRDGQYM